MIYYSCQMLKRKLASVCYSLTDEPVANVFLLLREYNIVICSMWTGKQYFNHNLKNRRQE